MKPDRLGCALPSAAIIAVVGVAAVLVAGWQPSDEPAAVVPSSSTSEALAEPAADRLAEAAVAAVAAARMGLVRRLLRTDG